MKIELFLQVCLAQHLEKSETVIGKWEQREKKCLLPMDFVLLWKKNLLGQ